VIDSVLVYRGTFNRAVGELMMIPLEEACTAKSWPSVFTSMPTVSCQSDDPILMVQLSCEPFVH
jgi:hypothetical protein